MASKGQRFKALTGFFKKLDYFGVQFSFDYKYNKKYRTALGGLIFFLFLVALVTFIAINLGSFLRRENMTIIYYSLKLAQTDKISFKNYSSTFAFKLTCDSTPDEEINDLIKLSARYTYSVSVDGKKQKTRTELGRHPCTKEDFYNEFDQSFDALGISKYDCIEMEDTQMEGQYADDVFAYYELRLLANTTEFEEKDKGNRLVSLMTENECQFATYFIDTMIDIHNYKEPIKRFLYEDFIVLKTDDYFKKNSFYKTQQFNWDNNWIFENVGLKYYLTHEDAVPYSIYKGPDRFIKKPVEYENLATIYLRAALNRNVINRKYAKLTEFIADQTSIFSKILLALAVSVMYMNYYFAYKSIIKRFFKISDSQKDSSRVILKEICNFFKNEPGDFFKENEFNAETQSSIKPLEGSSKKRGNNKKNGKKQTEYVKELQSKYKEDIKIVGVKETEKDTGQRQKETNRHFMRNVILSYLCPFIKVNKTGVDAKLKAIEANFFLKMDVRSYIKSSQIIDMLNYLLLSENRAGMLSFISNPCISFGNTEILKTVDSDIMTFFDVDKAKMKKFLVQLRELQGRESKSTLDDKFLKLIFKELKAVLENVGNKGSE